MTSDSSHKKLVKKSRVRKNTFLRGVMVLTVAGILVKIAGLSFKIPMNYIVGDVGMGYYNSAYSIYTMFYMLSTSGLPTAVSVMVSEKKASRDISSAKRVFYLAVLTFTIIGLVVSVAMFVFSDKLAALISSEYSSFSISAAAPAMLFVCISGAYRGYYQGAGYMTPTAVSQLIEAFGKLFIGIAASLYALRLGCEPYESAAYAVSGLTIGSLLSCLYLILTEVFRRDKDLLPTDLIISNTKPNNRDILARFFGISIPITLSASVMSLTNTIDTAMIQRMLISSGMTETKAAELYGNYTSLAVPMFNMPPVLVYPIAYSLTPIVASAMAKGRIKIAGDTICRSLRASVMIGLPCAMGMSVLSEPILSMLYKRSSAHIASPLLTLLAPSSFFVCILAVTNSVLQACGHERAPIVSMLSGAAVKLASGYVLMSRYGMSGVPISTFLCYLTVTALNLAFTVKYAKLDIFSVGGAFWVPFISSALCALAATFVYSISEETVGMRFSCLLAVISGAVVYFALLYVSGSLKTLTKPAENDTNQ